MFFLVLLGIAGTSYALVNAAGILFLGIAIALPVVALIFGALYVNDFTGVNTLIVKSFQTIVGVDTPNEMMPDCPPVDPGVEGWGAWSLSMVVLIVLFFIAIGTALAGLASIVMIPLGMAWSVLGSLASLFKRNPGPMAAGLKCLLYGAAGIIAVGISLRIMNEVYLAAIC